MMNPPLSNHNLVTTPNHNMNGPSGSIYPHTQSSSNFSMPTQPRVYQPWLPDNKLFSFGQDNAHLPRSTTTFQSHSGPFCGRSLKGNSVNPQTIQLKSSMLSCQTYIPDTHIMTYQQNAAPSTMAVARLNESFYCGNCSLLPPQFDSQPHFCLPNSVNLTSSGLIRHMFPAAHRLPGSPATAQYEPFLPGFNAEHSAHHAALLAVRDQLPSNSITRRSARCRCPNCLSPNPIKNKSGKKEHICHFPNCGKVYGKTSHLKAHIRWHLGERPFVCHWMFCGKSFTRSDELQRHLRTHTGEKKFKCSVCEKRFMRSDHLSKHVKIHQKKEAKKQEIETDSKATKI